MLQHNNPLERQRERRVRERVARRTARRLRRHVGSLRRLLALAVAVAFVGLGVAVVLAFRPAPEATPEPVLLGQGRAGIVGKTASVDVPPDTVRRPRRAPQSASREPGNPDQALGSGEASYYGDELRGRPTASGEAFNPEDYTAAHRSLPLGSRIRVTNLNNGRSVIVRVNDRGPFSGDRVLDVSKGAARQLDMIGRGTARVRMELILA